MRPASAHPALMAHPLSPGHLTPMQYHQETRRASLPGNSSDQAVSSETYHDQDPDHNSEVWQDIVRQLAVS